MNDPTSGTRERGNRHAGAGGAASMTKRTTTLCLSVAAVFAILLVLHSIKGTYDHPVVINSYGIDPIPQSHAIVRIGTPRSIAAFQPSVDLHSSKLLFQNMPSTHKETFYAPCGKACHDMIRPLRTLGWTRVNRQEDALLIWTFDQYDETDVSDDDLRYAALEPWQRYNHIPSTYGWDYKQKFVHGFRRYKEQSGFDAYFLPETYDLTVKEQALEFKGRVLEGGGLEHPWILKKPHENGAIDKLLLAPNSENLKDSYKNGAKKDYMIQRYICDQMTWHGGRQFNTRVYWFVASLDPLIVFFMGGYARIGVSEYKENDFNKTTTFLTIDDDLRDEGSFHEIEKLLVEHHKSDPARHDRIQDPVKHVKSQYKEAIARVVDAFKDDIFNSGNLRSTEDSFELYGADFVLDNEMDAWLVEPQGDPKMNEQHYFRLELHHNLYQGMITILEEIWEKQEKGLPILPIRNNGLWEMVYADGWMFEYEGYKRSDTRKRCEG